VIFRSSALFWTMSCLCLVPITEKSRGETTLGWRDPEKLAFVNQLPGPWVIQPESGTVDERTTSCLPSRRSSGSLEPVPALSWEGEALGGGMPGGEPMHTDVVVDRLRAGLEGRYTIERELGRGGMATVYLATDVKRQGQVALKLLHPEFATMVGTERFLREIDIVSELCSPHILPLYDSGQVDGLLYYVMPYVIGESVRDRIARETQLPIDDALAITKDIALGLSCAHEHGLIHRDIKPENILLEGETVVLADFGIARAVDVVAGEELTDSGLVVGTPEYMSPEQGQAHGKVDARSDIYSLGCVLYEMLVGEPPFTGATAHAIIARHMYETPRSISIIRSTLPTTVEDAVQSALAKLPAERPQTAERFAAMLYQDANTQGEAPRNLRPSH